MCWKCERPDATEADYDDFVRGVIDQYGWFIQAVYSDRLHPTLAYTVGLSRFGHAELVVSGLSQRRSADLLNSVATHMVHHDGGSLTHGEHVPWRGWPDIEVVELPEPSAHLFTAISIYGMSVRAQQLVYADDRGHWPWDVGFRGRQRVLGPRAPATV